MANLKCPKCQSEMSSQNNEMICPRCGYKVGAEIDFKRHKIKNEEEVKKENLRQGSKFGLGEFI